MSDLERYNPAAVERPSTFSIMSQAIELAGQVARTEFVPAGLRGKPEAVVAAILAGHELGLEPMTSLSKVHVVDGRPTLAAELMRALVLREGHELWLESATSTTCTMGGRRKGSAQATRITWTMDDARRAGLERKNNWRNYPRAMLIARATGELCRILFPDVLSGISYTREEVRDGFSLESEDAELEALEGADLAEGPPDDVEPAATPDEAPPNTRKAADVDDEPKAAPKAGTESRGRRAPEPAPEPPEPPLPGEADVPAEPAVDPAPAEEEAQAHGETVAGADAGPTYSPAQALAIRAREVGLDEGQRYGLNLALTEGRASSGKELSRDEIEGAFEVMNLLADGTASLERGDEGSWEVRSLPDGSLVFSSGPIASEPSGGPQSDETAESGDGAEEPRTDEEGAGGQESGESDGITVPTDEDGWRSLLRGPGRTIKLADALRTAAAFAGDPKKAPKSLAEIADNPALGLEVARWIAEEREA